VRAGAVGAGPGLLCLFVRGGGVLKKIKLERVFAKKPWVAQEQVRKVVQKQGSTEK
jgi:hypothetical protein